MEIIENKGYERLAEVFGPLWLIPHNFLGFGDTTDHQARKALATESLRHAVQALKLVQSTDTDQDGVELMEPVCVRHSPPVLSIK